MKIISLLFVFCIFSIISYSQELPTYNFKIEDGRLIWQKTFDTKLEFQGLIKAIKSTGAMDKPDTVSNQITGDLKQMAIDYKGVGKTSMNTWIILTRSSLMGYATIDYKSGKYRLTLKNLKLIQNFTDPLLKMGQLTPADELAIKNNEFKKAFLKQGAEILDYSINKAFAIDEKKTENW
jgi:hypothetical protein